MTTWPHALSVLLTRRREKAAMERGGYTRPLRSWGNLPVSPDPFHWSARFAHGRSLRDGAYRDRTGDLRLAKPALSQTELTPRTCMVEPNRERCALPILMRFLPRRFSCSSALAPSHEDREDNPPV